jgi:hypothetical protein
VGAKQAARDGRQKNRNGHDDTILSDLFGESWVSWAFRWNLVDFSIFDGAVGFAFASIFVSKAADGEGEKEKRERARWNSWV